jgi:zinc/manganese transport system substrate-binding protein
MTARSFAFAILVALLAASPAAAAKLKVVASFSIIGDIAARVAGDHVELKTLVGPDGDTHVFEPTTSDARAVAQARIFLVNGLNYEPWAERLLASTKSRAQLVAAANGTKPLALGSGATGVDPHAWQDVQNAVVYAQNIARAFAAADKPNAALYRSNAAAYIGELNKLDREIRAAFAAIPTQRRRVITTHDAFAHFGRSYGVSFVAPLGPSTDAQVSAKSVAALISHIKRDKIAAVFVENVSDPRLIEQIARETGVKLGGKLYSDALSPKSGAAPTYMALMRHNAKLLTEAMAPGF